MDAQTIHIAILRSQRVPTALSAYLQSPMVGTFVLNVGIMQRVVQNVTDGL